MKKIAALLTCFSVVLFSHGQDNNFNHSPVTLHSPEAAQFIRYGEVPVDNSTGVPNISVPLYTVTCGKLHLPLTISYHASGIKVQDIASTVGLGWSLNAGGLVSRTILGADDQQNKPKPFLSSTDLDNAFNYCHNNLTYANVQTLVETLADIIYNQNANQKESQSDRFFYSFNGRSGIFRTDFQTGVAKTVPYSALKISTGTNNAGPYTITTEDGTTYFFEQPELSGSLPGVPLYTSFYLTKIQSADLTSTITITYRQDADVTQRIKTYQLQHKVIFGGAWVNPQQVLGDRFFTLVRDNEFINYSAPVMPETITSDNEIIRFEYLADRPDLRASRLKRIKIQNRITNETVKMIEFQQSYSGTSSGKNQRLRLDKLIFQDKLGTPVQQYGFGYNSTALPPYYSNVLLGLWAEHHNVDYWGYYNGADDANLLPKEMFDPVRNPANLAPPDSYFTPEEQSSYGGNRNPNEIAAQACILKEITYPTGGKTSFEYELNRVRTYLKNT